MYMFINCLQGVKQNCLFFKNEKETVMETILGWGGELRHSTPPYILNETYDKE